MYNLENIYRRLRGHEDRSVTTAMVRALGTADEYAVGLIGLSLLERFDREGAVALVEHLGRFPEGVRGRVVARGGELGDAMARVVRSGGVRGRLNVCRVVVEGRVLGSSGLLVGLLSDPREEVVGAAAEGLLALSRVAGGGGAVADGGVREGERGRGGRGGRRESGREHLGRSVYEAVQRYDRHRRGEVLLGLCVLIDGGVLEPVCLGSCRSKGAVEELGRMLAAAEEGVVRRLLVPLSGLPVFRDAVRSGLLAAGERGCWAEVVGWAHLLLDPKSGRALSDVPDPHLLWPDAGALGGLDPEGQQGAVWWLGALPFLRSRRIEKLAGLRSLSDPLARLGALRRLMGERHESGFEAVGLFCDDEDAGVARVAARHLVRYHREDVPSLAATLVNSRHDAVRRIAGESLGQTGFAKLWEGWPRLTHDQRVVIGRALVKIDPRFHSHLGEKLVSREPQEVMRAMAIVRMMGQGAWFEGELVRLCEDSDVRVASAAVRTLAAGRDRATVGTIRAAMDSGDSRVRANAIEAMRERGESIDAERLGRMVREESNRPRANAIAVLMEGNGPAGVDALDRMLRDPDPMHRRSALWLAGAAGVTDVSAVVAEMAVSDPDGAVRDKAAAVTRRMIGLMDPSGAGTAAA